ncbi:MAG: hypothetical protein ACRDJ2_01895 [Actinomycetota bacterium]
MLLSVWVRTLGQERGVFGVRFVDEETRGAREVERVGAAGVVGRDQDLGREHRDREREGRDVEGVAGAAVGLRAFQYDPDDEVPVLLSQ